MVNQYVFEFKYKKVVFGKEKEFMNQIDVLDNNFNSACEKAIAHVQKNFSEYWCANGSSFKYVGERVKGVVKLFVEEVKEDKKMNTVYEMWSEKCLLENKVEQLEKRIAYFEKKREQIKPVKTKPLSIKTKEELFGEWYCREDVNMMKKICETIESKQPHALKQFDVASMYPQAVNVCKVYRIERDQALKENEELKKRVKYLIERNNRLEINEKYYDEQYRKLSDEKKTHEMVINGYKKELSQLNLLMDDMENRLEKQVVAREGMLKQLREYKAEKKRMNKIIDALTEDK